MTLFAQRLAVFEPAPDGGVPGRYDDVLDLRVDDDGRPIVELCRGGGGSPAPPSASIHARAMTQATITKRGGGGGEDDAPSGRGRRRDDDVLRAQALLVTGTREAPGDVDT